MQKIGTKLAIIGVVCVLFIIGMFFVRGLVSERQAYHQSVIDDIKSSHVSEQVLVTPFLWVDYGDKNGYIFAKHSDINAQIAVRDDEYERGIYQAVSFAQKSRFTKLSAQRTPPFIRQMYPSIRPMATRTPLTPMKLMPSPQPYPAI